MGALVLHDNAPLILGGDFMKSNYDKKQNILMILLFIGSISLTAGITAKLTKKANDNANKINQVNDDLTKLENLAKEDKAVKLYENDNVDTMKSEDASIELPISTLTDYSMLYINVRVDEGRLSEYVLTKSLTFKNDIEMVYFLNGDECGGNPSDLENGALFGAIVYLTKSDTNLNMYFYQVYVGQTTYSFNKSTTTYTDDSNATHDSGVGVFNVIYGIK